VTAQTLGRRLWDDPIFNDIDFGAGVLVHNMHFSDVNALMEVFDEHGDFQDWMVGDTDLVNDCHSDTNQDTSCSAWTWVKAGLQPMIYNYPMSADSEQSTGIPNLQHGVQIVVKAEDWFEATVKAHVVDGDTWSRKPAGINVDCNENCAPWQNGGPFGDDFLDDSTHTYTCVLVDDDANPISCDDDGCYAAVGEDGSKWIDRFTYDSGSGVVDKSTTMQGQCQFETLSDTRGAFENALGKFYQKAIDNKGSLSTTESGMYLENEVTMHVDKDDLTNSIMAVTVQLNSCAAQIPGSAAGCTAWYPDLAGKDEQAQMDEAKLQACRLSYSLIKFTGKQPTDVPVMSANFLSNAVVTDDWADYQSGAKTSGDWLSDITCECCDLGDFHPICAICPSRRV